MSTDTTTSRRTRTAGPTVAEVATQVAQLQTQVAELQQITTDRTHTASPPTPAEGSDPLYPTVEAWVRDYLLATFPRPVGEVGMVRWHWCEQWWRHDEAVTRLTALWYGWEHARLEMTGMLGWLRELDYHLPILFGDDGPFRNCAMSGNGTQARHQLPAIAVIEPAPEQWWDWWN